MSNKTIRLINRELSWLDFNERVLELSNSAYIPLMERLKFISIFANNLDEFFMIRVAGVIDQVDLGYNKKDASNLTPKEVLDRIKKRVKQLYVKEKRYLNSIKKALKRQHIFIEDDFNECSSEFCALVFENSILPSISPLTLSSSHPFPFIYNKRSVFVVELRKNNLDYISLIIIPQNLKKLFVYNTADGVYVYLLEHIIANRLTELFKGYEIKDYYIIRVTRNADLTIEEDESEDLLKLIEHQLDKRRKGQVVRLEINKKPSKHIERILVKNLDIEENDIYITSNFIDNSAFFELKVNNKGLYFKEFNQYIPKNIPQDNRIFDYIKENEILLYRPYNDFALISKLIEIASNDTKTLSIKITIYRTNQDSTIIKNLINAAINGKTVFVVIELKARFDEEMNVEWAKKLEEAGCVVAYGVENLKVHSKNLLITRNENGRIVKYSHVSTGNYNEETAKIYTDIDYVTSNDAIGADITNLFNFLMGYTDYADWKMVAISPFHLRKKLMQLIDYEIENAKLGRYAHIIIKVNSLIDKILIKKLYEASSNGVKIDLIVRGMCSIKTNIEDVSENIRVISVVGRFLEHPRIFYFLSNGQNRLFISSADFMERNMDKRIEYMLEITSKNLKNRLLTLLNLNLKDNINAWELDKTTYKKIQNKQKGDIDSQAYFIDNRF